MTAIKCSQKACWLRQHRSGRGLLPIKRVQAVLRCKAQLFNYTFVQPAVQVADGCAHPSNHTRVCTALSQQALELANSMHGGIEP